LRRLLRKQLNTTKCPKCHASTNDYGVYKGNSIIHCLKCKTTFNFKGEAMKETVKIGNVTVGLGCPCYLVAEIGINHNGDINIAKHLIDLAVRSGWNAVKFQKRTIDVVYSQEELAKPRESPFGNTNGDLKRGLEFGVEEYKEIDRYCKESNIPWFASGWDEESVDFLCKFNIPCLKIASASLTDDGLLKHVRSKGIPIILSTGMSTLGQVDHAVEVLGRDNLILLHTCSTYPSASEDLNLRAIPNLQRRYLIPVGFSGHETGIPSTVAAVAIGACVVERHVTLDRAMWGSDQAASLGPSGIIQLCRDIRLVELAKGNGIKCVMNSEIPVLKKLRRK
jgi:N-acetylneuraminate synthase